MKKQIVNFVFFLRTEEPREPDWDLLETFRRQTVAIDKYNFPVTYLLEYDVLINEEYRKILLEEKCKRGEECEIGGWFEIVRQLVEKAGLVWRGREGQNWDWHCNVGFSEGYTQEERELLIDTYFEDFIGYFGYYPKTVGSWIMDAHSIRYMYEKYGIMASCNCRDQIGVDGYTVWGGYFGQGYYPCYNNSICPANSEENQIPVPVFRMLGPDPIYNLDGNMDLDDSMKLVTGNNTCYTLEPAYQNVGGGCKKWVDWFLKENFPANTLSFNYVQAGQENAFNWHLQEENLEYQLQQFDKLRDHGFNFETMAETANWYRKEYPVTPASSMVALSDWNENKLKTYWYYSRFYRFNALLQDNSFIIRDIYLFDEKYQERYLDDVCTTVDMEYDNLPFIDGNRWSKGKIRSKAEFCKIIGDELYSLQVEAVEYSYTKNEVMTIKLIFADAATVTISLQVDKISICGDFEFALKLTSAEDASSVISVEAEQIKMLYNNYEYSVNIANGSASYADSVTPWIIKSEENKIDLIMYKATL